MVIIRKRHFLCWLVSFVYAFGASNGVLARFFLLIEALHTHRIPMDTLPTSLKTKPAWKTVLSKCSSCHGSTVSFKKSKAGLGEVVGASHMHAAVLH